MQPAFVAVSVLAGITVTWYSAAPHAAGGVERADRPRTAASHGTLELSWRVALVCLNQRQCGHDVTPSLWLLTFNNRPIN